MKNFKDYIEPSGLNEGIDYNHYLEKYSPDTSYCVGWMDGSINQWMRFSKLMEVGVEDGDSILDVGCGVGHMVDYLKDYHYAVEYTGLDINDNAIKIAETRHFRGQEQFLSGNIFEVNLEKKYDWVLASGTFNVGVSEELMWDILKECDRRTIKGIAFNLLSKPYIDEGYQSYWPEHILNNVPIEGQTAVAVDYSVKDDFTVYIRK
jgi:SAM-dependent methyltransferase